MNIFTRKKSLLAEIANLNEQIRIQSREMARLRKATAERKPKRNPKAASNHEQTSQQ